MPKAQSFCPTRGERSENILSLKHFNYLFPLNLALPFGQVLWCPHLLMRKGDKLRGPRGTENLTQQPLGAGGSHWNAAIIVPETGERENKTALAGPCLDGLKLLSHHTLKKQRKAQADRRVVLNLAASKASLKHQSLSLDFFAKIWQLDKDSALPSRKDSESVKVHLGTFPFPLLSHQSFLSRHLPL